MGIIGIIAGGIVIVSGLICLFLANWQYWELQSDVNERLPEGQKFEPVFWTPLARIQFRRLHKTVLPESARPKKAIWFATAGFVLLLSGIGMLEFALNLH